MSQEQMQYPDPEVTPKAKRRRFSAGYKLRVLGLCATWRDWCAVAPGRAILVPPDYMAPAAR